MPPIEVLTERCQYMACIVTFVKPRLGYEVMATTGWGRYDHRENRRIQGFGLVWWSKSLMAWSYWRRSTSTSDNRQNEQSEAQLKRKYHKLWPLIKVREKVAKQNGSSRSKDNAFQIPKVHIYLVAYIFVRYKTLFLVWTSFYML